MSRVEGPPNAGTIAAFALAGAIAILGADEIKEYGDMRDDFYRENPQVS